jgi:hypothetical protein
MKTDRRLYEMANDQFVHLPLGFEVALGGYPRL